MSEKPKLLAAVIDGLSAETPRVRFGCAKALRLLSETQPELLYSRFDFFVHLLEHQNKILGWEAVRVLANLTRVDAEDKFAGIARKYLAPIRGPMMITGATVIRSLPTIARARPGWADRLAGEILKVERARYQTPECRNVAIGHALVALGEFFDLVEEPAPVLRFARRQLRNPRPATRKKAEQFLRRARARTDVPQTGGRATWPTPRPYRANHPVPPLQGWR